MQLLRGGVSLRSKFLLIVLGWIVLPLGLIGFWLTRTIERAGEELLHSQLEQSLEDLAEEIGARWVYRQGDLLLLAGNEVVQRTLREPAGAAAAQHDSSFQYVRDLFAELQDVVEWALYYDAEGVLRWSLSADPALVPQIDAAPSPGSLAGHHLPVSIEIMDDATGERLGRMEARLRFGRLLSSSSPHTAIRGAVLSVIRPGTGEAILPTPLPPGLLRQDRFEWEDRRWLSARRRLEEPAAELVLAAPRDLFVQPFERAARNGLLALLAVAGAVLVGAVWLTHRLTSSLRNLASAAEAVACGDLERRVEDRGEDEVARLARAFNIMTQSLRRTLGELSQRQALAAVGEFASALAHEVRNPLTSIRLDLQRVEEKLPHDSRLREPLARALASLVRLNHTVTGALRIARSGRVELEATDLHGSLEAALHRAAAHAAAHSVTIEPLPADTADLSVSGDGAALEQLFLNLLLNAVEAVHPGGRVGVRLIQAQGEIVVSVWDTGKGIAATDLERVFDPFYTTRREGTGLGLPIAQRIAAAHGGSIDIRSSEQGTTVDVKLPLQRNGGRSARPEAAAGA